VLRITITGLDRILPALGVDQLPQTTAEKIAPALNAIERFAPGLGSMMRERAGSGVAAGLTAFGEPAQLEGKPAITLPLRFSDGAISRGPLPVGRVPPLF
jgi:hypothetical protein